MAAASTAPTSLSPAPSPEECQHPAPVRGVMAHEFAHFDGSTGPEGVRRTVTYYGPVIGGLPIAGWHCQVCGLLRLDFPDGRREERRLYPGPQPGLLARPSVVSPGQDRFGEQARVSGLSIPAPVYAELYAEQVGLVAPRRLPRVELPSLGGLGWANVVGLAALILGLVVAAVLAVAGTSVPSSEGPLVLSLAVIFGALLLANAVSPLWKRWFPMPPLAPSIAQTARSSSTLDAATKTAVWFLAIAILLFGVAAVLAVDDYNTSAGEGPVFLAGVVASVIAALTVIGGAISRTRR